MHELVKQRLEEYLKGAADTAFPREFTEHLETCEKCRNELHSIEQHSQLLHVLRWQREAEPRAGFYARVMERIEDQRKVSMWNVFLEPAFVRRIATASLVLMLLLGSYFALTEGQSAHTPNAAEAIMAVEDHPPGLGTNQDRDRNTILVTLATYQE